MIAAASTFKSAFALLETTPRRCACLSPVVPGQPVGSARFASYFRVGDLAAVLRELLHHLLVQPDSRKCRSRSSRCRRTFIYDFQFGYSTQQLAPMAEGGNSDFFEVWSVRSGKMAKLMSFSAKHCT